MRVEKEDVIGAYLQGIRQGDVICWRFNRENGCTDVLEEVAAVTEDLIATTGYAVFRRDNGIVPSERNLRSPRIVIPPEGGGD